jgi:hypothetical protein
MTARVGSFDSISMRASNHKIGVHKAPATIEYIVVQVSSRPKHKITCGGYGISAMMLLATDNGIVCSLEAAPEVWA